MKIHPDQLQAIEQEQAKSKAASKADKGFGDILSQELEGNEQTSETQSASLPPLGSTISSNVLAAQATTGESSESGQEVMDRLENLLGEWDSYASNIDSSDLKQANESLENIENEVASLKENLSSDTTDEDTQSVLNEVELLATTERFKFNRGDYI